MNTNHQPEKKEERPTTSLREHILRKINAHELSMRPRAYFVLKIAALVAVTIATLVVSVFILNFILFSVRINNDETLLRFGPRGIAAFIAFFPWGLLVIDLALVLAIQWLLRHFKFGYKTPLLYLVLGLVLATLIVGFVVDRASGINEHFLHKSEQHRLSKPFDHFYGRSRRPPPPGTSTCRCVIVAISGNTLVVQDSRSTSTLTVMLPGNDPRATTTSLKVGDIIVIAGDIRDGMIHAFGVRKVDNNR